MLVRADVMPFIRSDGGCVITDVGVGIAGVLVSPFLFLSFFVSFIVYVCF